MLSRHGTRLEIGNAEDVYELNLAESHRRRQESAATSTVNASPAAHAPTSGLRMSGHGGGAPRAVDPSKSATANRTASTLHYHTAAAAASTAPASSVTSSAITAVGTGVDGSVSGTGSARLSAEDRRSGATYGSPQVVPPPGSVSAVGFTSRGGGGGGGGYAGWASTGNDARSLFSAGDRRDRDSDGGGGGSGEISSASPADVSGIARWQPHASTMITSSSAAAPVGGHRYHPTSNLLRTPTATLHSGGAVGRPRSDTFLRGGGESDERGTASGGVELRVGGAVYSNPFAALDAAAGDEEEELAMRRPSRMSRRMTPP